MGKSDSLTDPVEFRFVPYIHQLLSCAASARASHATSYGCPACRPWYPGSPPIGFGSLR